MKKLRKRDKYLIGSVIAVIIGFAVNVWLAHGDHSLPDVVNAGWFGFWSLEIYQIARITIKGKVNNDETIS